MDWEIFACCETIRSCSLVPKRCTHPVSDSLLLSFQNKCTRTKCEEPTYSSQVHCVATLIELELCYSDLDGRVPMHGVFVNIYLGLRSPGTGSSVAASRSSARRGARLLVLGARTVLVCFFG